MRCALTPEVSKHSYARSAHIALSFTMRSENNCARCTSRGALPYMLNVLAKHSCARSAQRACAPLSSPHKLIFIIDRGQCVSFGRNSCGQLGQGSDRLPASELHVVRPVQLPDHTTAVTHVASGYYHTLCLTGTRQSATLFAPLGSLVARMLRFVRSPYTGHSLPNTAILARGGYANRQSGALCALVIFII